MSDALNCAEFDGQQVELLPARTVLSMFAQGDSGVGAPGVDGVGTLGGSILGIPIGSGSGNGIGGPGGSSNGGGA
ncbi:MAG: hypothetical protein WBF75_24390 [Pseudonocardiaceae bacterium]